MVIFEPTSGALITSQQIDMQPRMRPIMTMSVEKHKNMRMESHNSSPNENNKQFDTRKEKYVDIKKYKKRLNASIHRERCL